MVGGVGVVRSGMNRDALATSSQLVVSHQTHVLT